MPLGKGYQSQVDEDDQLFLDLWKFSRELKNVTEFVKEQKRKSGVKTITSNLAVIALKIAATAMGAGGTELLGTGTIGVEAGVSEGPALAELSAEGIAVPIAQKVSDKTTQQTSRSQILGGDEFDAFHNPAGQKTTAQKVKKIAAEKAKGAVCLPQLLAVAQGLKQMHMDRGDWQRSKREMITKINTIIGFLDEIIDWDDHNKKVTWKATKRPLIKKKTITSGQLIRKYRERVRAFNTAVAKRGVRKEASATEPLL